MFTESGIYQRRKKRKREFQKIRKQKADDCETANNIDQCTSRSCVQTLEVEHDDCTEFIIPNNQNKESGMVNYTYVEAKRQVDDDMPSKYRNIRLGERQVRPEIYQVIQKLKSTLHMSQAQAEGSIVEIANTIFGRNKFGPWSVLNVTNHMV